jgi:hypothetical protein
LHYPLLFLIFLILFAVLAVWLIPKLWRAICFLWRKLRSIFSSGDQAFPGSGQGKNENHSDFKLQ